MAAEIDANEDFQDELKRLSTSFGIGVLKLDIRDPDSSEIVFPARFRDALDWDAINKLTLNPDFDSFLKRVTNDIVTKEIRKERYDKVLSSEDLLNQIAHSNED